MCCLNHYRLPLLIITLLSLSACQNRKIEVTVPLNDQITQLSSLAGATKYLKYHCERSDIPNDEQIELGVIYAAREKGWDTNIYSELDQNGFLPIHRIQQRSNDIYQSLVNDKTLKSEKCSEFNTILAPYIALIQSKSKR